MSDDFSEVGGFEPKRYMGHLLIRQYHERPHTEEEAFVKEVGVYRKYNTDTPFYCHLIDDKNGHYYLAKEELYNDAEM